MSPASAAVFSESKSKVADDPALEGPVEVAPNPEDLLRTHMKERIEFAKGLYFRKLYDIALEEFKSVYDSAVESEMVEESLYGLSETLFSKKMYWEAFQHFRKYEAILEDGDRKDLVMRRMAECLFFLNKKAEALIAFQKLISSQNLDVKYASYYFSGKILFEQNELQKAKPFFETLYTTVDEANAFRNYSAYYLAEIEADADEHEKSDQYFKVAFESGATDIQQMAMFGAGRLMFELKNYDQSAEYFMNAYKDGTDKEIGEDALVGYMKALFSNQKFNELIETFNRYHEDIRETENKVAVRLLNARAYERSNRPEQAHLLFKELFEAGDIPVEILATAQMSHVEFLIRNNQANEALSILNAMKSFASISDDRIAYLRALAQDRTGDIEKAHVEYNLFLSEFPASSYRDEIVLSSAYLYLKEEKFEEAIPQLLSYIEEYADQPMVAKVTSDLILAYIKIKKTNEAVEWSNKYMNKYKDQEGAAEVHSRLAAVLSESGEREKAAEVYKQHLEMFPHHQSNATLLAAGYNEQLSGNYIKAIEFYEKIQFESTEGNVSKDALMNLAFSAVQLNQLDLAAKAYLQILTEYPEQELEPEIYFWMTEYYVSKSDVTSMETVLNDFQNHPNFTARKTEWLYYSAELSRLKENYPDAELKYRACIDAQQFFISESWTGLGRCARQQSDYVRAITHFNQALRAAGDNNRLAAQNRMEIGKTLLKQERYEEAAKAFLAVGILYEDDVIVPQALSEAGEAFKKAGKLERADQIFAELNERYKDYPRVQSIETVTKELAS